MPLPKPLRHPFVPIVLFAGLMLWLAFKTASSFLRGKQGDFHVFYQAAEAVREGADIYASGVGGYLYPPMLATAFVPLTWLSLGQAGAVWAIVNGVMLAAAAWLMADEALRRFGLPRSTFTVASAALLGSAVVFDKAKSALAMGQTDLLILLGLVLALRWVGRAPLLCGVAFGVVMNVKYLAVMFLPYLLLRRRWGASAAFVGGTLMVSLSTALVFGWQRNLAYLGSSLGALGEVVGLADADATVTNPNALTWDRSVSVTSATARLVEGSDHATLWLLLGVGGVALAVTAVCWSFYAAKGLPVLRDRGGRGDEAIPRRRALVLLEWSGVIVATLAFSPQTDGRHMVIALPAVMAASVLLLHGKTHAARALPLAGLVIFVAGLYLPPGGKTFEAALDGWRSIGGASWCLLAMYLCVLWSGLARARTLENDAEPAND
ncbi:MAG: glycosyltransferase family 87 protein [Planctomycetota bacterium]